MKYAHLADAHLGSWRDLKMRDLATKAFLKAIDDCIKKEVDFVLFTGDLFNTSLPALDILKIITKKLKELNQKEIPFYAIPGSHDFSPSGKTMIDVLENAGLLINVCKGRVDLDTKKLNLKFTEDKKTGVKITGMLGKKGMLDRIYYENLNLEPLEQETGYKIFLFHTTLTELKPPHLAKIESQPLSFLPKNFNYYAGGHIHHPTIVEQANYGTFTYPGALFPNNFAELEKYSFGNYYLVEVNNNNNNNNNILSGGDNIIRGNGVIGRNNSTFDNSDSNSNNKINDGNGDVNDNKVDDVKSNNNSSLKSNNQTIELIPVKVIEHKSIIIKCSHKTPEVIAYDILNEIQEQDITNQLITIRLSGTLNKGKTSDIDFKQIFNQMYNKGAYFVMKNTSQLQSEEFEEIKLNTSSPEQIEDEIIKEHLQQIKLFDQEKELTLTKEILHSLNTEKKEGETITDFQRRVVEEMNQLLELEEEMKE